MAASGKEEAKEKVIGRGGPIRVCFVTATTHKDHVGDDMLTAEYSARRTAEQTATEDGGCRVVCSTACWDDLVTQDWTAFHRWADLVVIRSTWNYHEHIDEFRTWLDTLARAQATAHAAGIPCWVMNPIAVMKWNAVKSHYLPVVERQHSGLTCPTVRLAKGDQTPNLKELLASRGWAACVMKPEISAAAFHTRLSGSDLSSDEAWLSKRLAERGMMIQPFLPAIKSDGEWSYFFMNGVFAYAVHKSPQQDEREFVVHFSRTKKVDKPPQNLLEVAQRAMTTVPDANSIDPVLRQPLKDTCLYARVDMINTGDKIYVMEIELVEPYLYMGVAERPDALHNALIAKWRHLTSTPLIIATHSTDKKTTTTATTTTQQPQQPQSAAAATTTTVATTTAAAAATIPASSSTAAS